MSKTKHLPALDGVRGIAIIAVVLCHSTAIVKDIPQLGFLGYGYIGVDVFFVLSGFLITSILLREIGSDDYFKNFYMRRALRIWPLYYLFIAVQFVLGYALPHLNFYRQIVAHSEHMQMHKWGIATPMIVCLLFGQNLWYPTLFGSQDATSITWSLCIEEQFYIVWPILVRLLSRRSLKIVLACVLMIEPLLRAFVYHSDLNATMKWELITRFPLFHLDSIAAGSLLALVWPEIKDLPLTPKMLWGALVACAPLSYFFLRTGNPITYSVAMLLGASMVGIALLGTTQRFLAAAPLTFLGAISYGLYLVHPTVFGFLQSRTLYRSLGLTLGLKVTELLAAILAISVSIGIATFSRYTFEQFFLNLKNRKSRGAAGLIVLAAQPGPEQTG